MRSSTTFSVLFFPKPRKIITNIQHLYLRITLDSQRVEYSLKKKIDIAEWDTRRGQMKGSNPDARRINTYLDQLRSEIFEAYDQLRKENKLLTAEAIKARFLHQDKSEYTLIQAVEYHYKLAQSTLRTGTLSHYRVTENYIRQFLIKKMKVKDIYLSQLTYGFITKFENFMRMHVPVDHQRPMGNNTTMKHLQRFRKIISVAVRMEWMDNDPFMYYKTKFVKKERQFLSQNELDSIEKLRFIVERLDFVKDLFIFGCYTGLSYIDAINLTPDNIVYGIDGGKWIFSSRKKTGNTLKIPLLETAEKIILKYKDNPRALNRGTLFPKISNQKLNSYLKEIADQCGITTHLTFHIARHTFATTVTLMNGVPLETVSKLLGHAKISSTQIYAKVIESKVSEDMADLRKKINLKKQIKDSKKKAGN
jgi:site-specific recombinase XerD